MKFVLITKDADLVKNTEGAFQPNDELLVFENWQEALDACQDADLLFCDLLATLEKPHKIAGYEKFAEGKMDHATASATPLVLIAPPDEYELDFMAGYPNFVFAHIRRPVTYKIFRRASTWV